MRVLRLAHIIKEEESLNNPRYYCTILLLMLSTVNLSGCENPTQTQIRSLEMSEKSVTVDIEPIEEFEHYIKMSGNIYGINRDTELENWRDLKISFPVKINGKEGFITPSEFFVSSGNVYFSCKIGEDEYCLKQSNGVVTKIDSLPAEPEQNRIEFSGTIGKFFEVEYKKDPKYNTWKHVKNDKGHFLNHQSSDFAFPIGRKALLYVRDTKMLYVIYTMPNGLPAKSSTLSIPGNIEIW